MKLNGFDVIVNDLCDNVPRMQPSAEFRRLMTPEMVADLEAWMIEFFGREDVIYMANAGFGQSIVMGPRNYARLMGFGSSA